MTRHHLAQLNIATMREPLDSPVMAGFVENLERINGLADAAPGFVWRLKDDEGDATAIRPFGEDKLVNLSVWESVEALREFAFRSAHAEIMRRRREWFERMEDAYAVLWWVPAGHVPTTEEAARRLDHLRRHGPTPEAFTFSAVFPAG
ncbi:MAG: DUF3291 domain-containing protein [Steroidobacteraceae bacterium]